VTIPKATVPPPPGGQAKPKPPALTKLRLSPGRFRPANRRHPTRGTTLAYRDTEAATTTFSVQRKRAGVRRGKRCLAPPKHPRKGHRHVKRCTRFVPVKGTFHHADTAGADAVHWNGRIRGRALAPGAYRLLARAVQGRARGKLVTRGFTIRR
jgi:hypothetical protein